MAHNATSLAARESRRTGGTGRPVRVVTLALLAGAFVGVGLSAPGSADGEGPAAVPATAPITGALPGDEWPW